MKKLFLILLVFNFIKTNSRISGFVFLNEQSNHADIKIKFKANSAADITDSHMDVSGAFSKNISGLTVYSRN